MSTFRAETISNIPGTGSPTITGGELSRARINFDGTGAVAVRDSFNISSVTDNGTGDYTATFSIAMPNTGYSAVGGALSPGVSSGNLYIPAGSVANQAVASFRMIATNVSDVATDLSYIQAIVVGDKP